VISRRQWLGLSLRTTALLVLASSQLRALPQSSDSSSRSTGPLIQRPIPSSGETLPVIGLAFSNHPSCADQAELREVVKAFADNGGMYLDATLGNAANQQFHLKAASDLGVADKLFWSTTAFLPGPGSGPGSVKTQIDSTLASLELPRIDLAWVTVMTDPAVLAELKEEQKAGRVRYIGVMTILAKSQAAQLEALLRNESIDFIGVDYDISNRFVEETILPLALEKKIGVIAYFPFSNNAGTSCSQLSRNLFARVGTTPLPEWAAEFDANTWAQFFLKYVISHPAVTVARTGTTKAEHMRDNLGGGVGRLPDEATRKRMADLIDSLPPLPPLPQKPAPGIAVPAVVLDRYVGEYKSASGFTAIFRRDGDKFFVKPGPNPEIQLNAHTETRFQDPRGPFFEFQLDEEKKVTGAVLEMGANQRLKLERKS
jgi:aryl-alcohol dehydrogenase-like predicted oxidoreductase